MHSTDMTKADPDLHLRKSYDREAHQYDALRYESAEGQLFNDMELRVLQEWLPLGPGFKVLDLPAGTGRVSVALARTQATVLGGDISANMLKQAASKARTEGTSHLHFVQSSGTHLPFADNTFDAVASFKFFHLIPNDRKPLFVREMARVLKPGKSLVIEFNSPYYGGVLAALRYYFRKKKPGRMRMRCIFPDQIPTLFESLEVTRKYGVKLPFAGLMSSIIGRQATESFNLWVGRLPGLRYFCYAIIVEARKPVGR
jgi:ubiquinone/menaquinone biosynthesis C-methylase UbiE